MSTIDPRQVIIPPHRQRRDLGNLSSLTKSIHRYPSLLQPIVIQRGTNELVIGERRLRVALDSGLTEIEFRYTDETDPIMLHLMELEENVQRKDLTWQEQHDATVKYYQLRLQQDPTLTYESVGEEIGIGKAAISQHLTVEKVKDHPLVKNADSFGTARNNATRIVERLRQDELNVHGLHSKPEAVSPIIVADFNEWAPAYDGPKFNLIHCDFPYGIESHKSEGQHPALPVTYKDTAEIYWQLFKTLSVYLDNFCAESAHMIFWFSPALYCQTWEMLKLLDGFTFDEYPLIWQRGLNEGIAPDPQRRPRRIYEMAFFGWRGDRRLVKTKANCVTFPTTRVDHPHEKSQLALEHFFEMCVDGQTRLIDPTCGSGSALRAADALGASYVFGLERDEQFAADAKRAFAQARSDRRFAETDDAAGEVS